MNAKKVILIHEAEITPELFEHIKSKLSEVEIREEMTVSYGDRRFKVAYTRPPGKVIVDKNTLLEIHKGSRGIEIDPRFLALIFAAGGIILAIGIVLRNAYPAIFGGILLALGVILNEIK